MLFDLFACTFITPLLGYIIQWYHLPVLLQLKQSGKKIPFWLSAALCCFYYRWTRKQCWVKRYLSFLSVLARHYFRAWQLPVFVQQFSYLKITNKNPSNSIPSTISKVRKQKKPKQTNQTKQNLEICTLAILCPVLVPSSTRKMVIKLH